MIRHSFITKLILFLVLFFTAIILLLGLVNAQITQENLKQSEEDKIETIVETVLPIISINLSFGFDQSIEELLTSLPKGNKNILAARILNKGGDPLYSTFQNDRYRDIFTRLPSRYFYHASPIIDPATKETLGKMEIVYSNIHYQKIKYEYFRALIVTIVLIFAAFSFFIVFFYKKLSPLKVLSNALVAYDPAKNNPVVIPKQDGKDEIAVINNSAREMLDKINEYTATLNDLNQNLELKIKKELQKNREKDELMIKQSRQAALGEMIGNIAHQWRQPINALGLLIQDIEDADEHGELNSEYITHTVEQSMELIEHMSETIDDFRNFFMPNKDKSYFLLNEAVDNAMKIVGASLAYHNITVRTEIEPSIHIFSYKNEFTQVLINLLNNSKDAYNILKHKEPREILIRGYLVQGDQEIIIHVQDHAGGIKPAILHKVFDPYFTTKHKEQGTGVGLYMSKSIIEANMGGSLLASNTDDGVIMTITLPLSAITMQIEQV